LFFLFFGPGYFFCGRSQNSSLSFGFLPTSGFSLSELDLSSFFITVKRARSPPPSFALLLSTPPPEVLGPFFSGVGTPCPRRFWFLRFSRPFFELPGHPGGSFSRPPLPCSFFFSRFTPPRFRGFTRLPIQFRSPAAVTPAFSSEN